MKIILHKKFEKRFSRLPKKLKLKTKERIILLLEDKSSPLLNLHELKGAYQGFMSINVTGDYRIIFEELEDGSILLLLHIGTHSQLYG